MQRHPGRNRVHRPALREELQGVSLPARRLRHPAAALAATPAEDLPDRDPGGGAAGRLRPRVLWLTHLVLQDRDAAALLSGIRGGRQGPRRQALQRVCRLPALLERQPERGEAARDREGRQVHRRHPLHLSGRPDPLVAVAAQLLRQGRDARAVARDQDPADSTRTT
jgi:hypothetical protein